MRKFSSFSYKDIFGQEMCRIAKNVFGKYLCLNLFEYSFSTKRAV